MSIKQQRIQSFIRMYIKQRENVDLRGGFPENPNFFPSYSVCKQCLLLWVILVLVNVVVSVESVFECIFLLKRRLHFMHSFLHSKLLSL